MTDRLDVIDVNCLIGEPARPTPVTPYQLNQLTDELDRFGISQALVAQSEALEGGFREGNAALLGNLAGTGRLTPVWALPMHTGVDFDDPESTVAEMLAAGVRAVRIQPSPYHGTLCAPWALGPLWPELERRRVPVLLDKTALGVYPDQPANGFTAAGLHEISSAFPDLPMILLRVNFSALRVLVPLMRERQNIHAELSFFTAHRGVEYLAGQIGSDRLVYGSGLPWGSPGPGIAAIRYSGLSFEEQNAIAGGNARRLLAAVKAG